VLTCSSKGVTSNIADTISVTTYTSLGYSTVILHDSPVQTEKLKVDVVEPPPSPVSKA
jgi:hypothetical protein